MQSIPEAAIYLDITLGRALCTLIVYFKREAGTRIERSVAFDDLYATGEIRRIIGASAEIDAMGANVE